MEDMENKKSYEIPVLTAVEMCAEDVLSVSPENPTESELIKE